MPIYAPSQEFINEMCYESTPATKKELEEECTSIANIFEGEDNGNYGNPTGYTHSEVTRAKISKNNSRHWLDADVPWKGKPRPDSVEIAKQMGKNRKGCDPWNKGLVGAQVVSDETKLKMSLAKKGKAKPQITCPHCGKTGGKPAMKQWHFDNCKGK